MADGFTQIPRCAPGGVSLVSAEYANKLIDMLNAMGGGTVAPAAGVGSFKLARNSYVLDLTPLDLRVRQLEAGGGGGSNPPDCCNNLQQQVDDLTQIVVQQNSDISGMQVQISNLQNSITVITARLDAATVDASCSNGNVTVTLNL